MSTVSLKHPVMFLAEGQYRISRSPLLVVEWQEPSKKDGSPQRRSDVYVDALALGDNGEGDRKITLKVNGRFWEDFTASLRQIDSISKKYGKSGYDPREWVTVVDADKRLVSID